MPVLQIVSDHTAERGGVDIIERLGAAHNECTSSNSSCAHIMYTLYLDYLRCTEPCRKSAHIVSITYLKVHMIVHCPLTVKPHIHVTLLNMHNTPIISLVYMINQCTPTM